METKLIICINRRLNPRQPSCAARGAEALAERLEQALDGFVEIERVNCLGECETGPNMRLAPGGPFFRGVDEGSLDEVIAAALEFAAAPEATPRSSPAGPR